MSKRKIKNHSCLFLMMAKLLAIDPLCAMHDTNVLSTELSLAPRAYQEVLQECADDLHVPGLPPILVQSFVTCKLDAPIKNIKKQIIIDPLLFNEQYGTIKLLIKAAVLLTQNYDRIQMAMLNGEKYYLFSYEHTYGHYLEESIEKAAINECPICLQNFSSASRNLWYCRLPWAETNTPCHCKRHTCTKPETGPPTKHDAPPLYQQLMKHYTHTYGITSNYRLTCPASPKRECSASLADTSFHDKEISLYPPFFESCYGVRKIGLFHEFIHTLQHAKNCTEKPSLLYPEKYTSAEAEADSIAIEHVNCYLCTLEFAAHRPAERLRGVYLSGPEIAAIAKKMDHEQLCTYHKEYRKRLGSTNIHPADWLTQQREMQDVENKIAAGELKP